MFRTRIYTLAALITLLWLAGCGGGGSGDNGDAPSGDSSLLSGLVADGYLRGATVFLDINGNRLPDAGEPQTLSTNGGYYEIDPGNIDRSAYPVVALVTAGVTVDEDSPGTPITTDYLLETPVGKHAFISPLTTLVKVHMDQNPGVTVQDAEVAIRLEMGLGHEVTLFEDYVAAAAPGDPSARAQDARKCYNAARVVADLMEDLNQALRTNLGSNFEATDKKTLQFILSDRIRGQRGPIRTAVADGSTLLPDNTVESVANSLRAAIEPSGLDRNLVAFYNARINEQAAVWDTRPPGLTHRLPAANQPAPVNTTVTLTFDEELDPSTISDASVTLISNGATVTGTVSYNAEQKTLTFTPSGNLAAFTTYTVVLSPQLKDRVGNSVDESSNWSFTTIFDGTPPPPPSFG